jgi:zinc protease
MVAPLRYGPVASVPDDASRAAPPARAPVIEIVDAEPRWTTYANGMRVVLFERHEFPAFAARLVLDRGALDLDDAGALQVSQTMYLYGRGGSEDEFERVADDTMRSGTRYDEGSSASALWADARGPAASFDAALDTLSRLTAKAHLTPEEYEHREAEWKEGVSGGPVSLPKAMRRVLFGTAHPYGDAGPGRASVPMATALSIHDRLFQPSQATLVIVGDVAQAQVDAAVVRAFGAWVAGSPVSERADAPLSALEPRVSVVPHHGLAQLRAAVFARGPAPSSDDVIVLSVVANLLGGAKSSKLFEHLRQETGDIYSADSGVALERTASIVSVTASYDVDKAVDGVGAVLRAIRDLRAGNVSEEDIEVARETALADWRASMATTAGAAAGYGFWIGLGLDPERVRALPGILAKVGREDVLRVANTYLTDKALRVVFLGEDRWLDPSPLRVGRLERLDLGK